MNLGIFFETNHLHDLNEKLVDFLIIVQYIAVNVQHVAFMSIP